MATVKIKCPGCNKQFNLKAPNVSNLMQKPFTCPKCGFTVPFSTIIPHGAKGNPALHTHIATGNPGILPGGKTTMTHHAYPVGQRITLTIDGSHAQFPLFPGVYVLGRNCHDSMATLKLAADPYMSRKHAQLNVLARDGRTECRLSPMSSQNPVFVNNRVLERGSSVVLASGDKITLGMTTILFSIQ